MTERIVVIDADEQVLEDRCHALRAPGRSIEVHTSAESAWASLDRDPPDLVILNAGTPGPVGSPLAIEVLRHFGRSTGMIVFERVDDAGPWQDEALTLVARIPRGDDSLERLRRTVDQLLQRVEVEREELDIEVEKTPVSDPGSSGGRRAVLNSGPVSVLHKVSDGVLLTNSRGRIVLVNSAAERLLGMSSDAVLRRSLIEVLDPRSEFAEFAHEALEAAPFERGPRRVSVDGERLLEVRSMRIVGVEEHGEGLYFSMRDVTHEVRLQKLRGHFLTVVSHELRTPLTALENLVTLLLPDQGDRMSSLQRQLVEGARHQILRLGHQVDKLVLLARLEKGEEAADAESFSLEEVVHDAATTCRFQAAEQGTAFGIECQQDGIFAYGDREDTRKAVYELLENAVKFTPPDGSVCVRIEQDEDEVRVVVEDDGIGIDSRHHQAIFDEFQQLEEPMTRTYGGAGLGLALARRVVAPWGGSLEVESIVGGGSTFTLRLRRPPVGEPGSVEAASEPLLVACQGESHE